MQNAELFRRGIVLPDNAEAEDGLRNNNVDESTSVQYLKIPDESFFEALWELQLFQEINARTGSLIDDYEEEFIDPPVIGRILNVVKEVRLKEGAQLPEIQSFLSNLSDLASKAAELQRGLLFVL